MQIGCIACYWRHIGDRIFIHHHAPMIIILYGLIDRLKLILVDTSTQPIAPKIVPRCTVHARSQGGFDGFDRTPAPQPEPRPTMVAIIRTTIVPSTNMTDLSRHEYDWRL